MGNSDDSGDFSGSQWLKLCAANSEDVGSIPGQGTKIPHAVKCSQKIF